MIPTGPWISGSWIGTSRLGVATVLIGTALLLLFVQTEVIPVTSADVGLYRWWGEAIARGAVPYRDVPIEYPPGAIPLFVVPAFATSAASTYSIAFAGLVGLAGAVALVLAARIGAYLSPASRGWTLRTLAAGVMVGLMAAVALTRFDFVPSVLTAGALYALVRERNGCAGALLGTAIAVKVYPAVIVPLAVAYAWKRGGGRAIVTFGATAGLVLGCALSPALIAAGDGVAHSFSGQLERPLQVESSAASVLWLAHQSGLSPWPVQSMYFNLSFPEAERVALWSTVAGGAVLGYLWIRHAWMDADAARLIRYSFACIAAFVVFAKVLSPQFLIWLIVMVPAIRGARANLIVALLLTAVMITALYFPRGFVAAGANLDAGWLNVIAVRNLLLASMLFIVAIPVHARYVRSRAPTRV